MASTMQREALFTRIDDCLRRQIDAGQQLSKQLQLEALALDARDAVSIEAVLAPKQNALQAFGALDQERERLLSEAGCTDLAHAEPWLASADTPQTSATLAHWRQLIALAAECSRQNQINGQLIQASLRHTRQVIELLSGRPPEETAPYGPTQPRQNAASSSHSPGHSLGKA
ncbi:MAG: flagellar protein FlgN [Chromatiales bacterium]|jgi:flagellar biosynthesis/type III secretory pathway chaperone|nr:flagellar protein FlgN [Chromatiales bacterium]